MLISLSAERLIRICVAVTAFGQSLYGAQQWNMKLQYKDIKKLSKETKQEVMVAVWYSN